MSIKLLTEHHLKFLSLKGGCTGSSESTLVKMPHCWKSHATAPMQCSSILLLVLWAQECHSLRWRLPKMDKRWIQWFNGNSSSQGMLTIPPMFLLYIGYAFWNDSIHCHILH